MKKLKLSWALKILNKLYPNESFTNVEIVKLIKKEFNFTVSIEEVALFRDPIQSEDYERENRRLMYGTFIGNFAFSGENANID